jgi:hypothetical protein
MSRERRLGLSIPSPLSTSAWELRVKVPFFVRGSSTSIDESAKPVSYNRNQLFDTTMSGEITHEIEMSGNVSSPVKGHLKAGL